MSDGFVLDAQIEKDSVFIKALALCDVRLMREKRWFWLVLVPRTANATEIFDLSPSHRALLIEEINFAAQCLQQAAKPCDKINIASLGNIVHQLHLHITARLEGDAAWPHPIWGHGTQQIPSEQLLNERLVAIKALLDQ